jgi:hypothetical protein
MLAPLAGFYAKALFGATLVHRLSPYWAAAISIFNSDTAPARNRFGFL